MIVDFLGCWLVEVLCKYLFADLEPKNMITRGRERRETRRVQEEWQRRGNLDNSVAIERKLQ
jgi:cation-transporting ATPase 13A1